MRGYDDINSRGIFFIKERKIYLATGRYSIYNRLTSPEQLEKVNPENIRLMNDFLAYLSSIDRSPKTIEQYEADLKIFWVYLLEKCDNVGFTALRKRDLVAFQNHAIKTLQWSPNRIRRVKAVLSSLSNYIENMLDEEPEYEGYRSIVRKIESPANEPVRDKTVLTDEQIDLLLNTLKERGEYEKMVSVAIVCFSGMRKAELLQMKMEYFEPDHLVYGCLYRTDKVRAKGRGVRGKQIYKYIMNKIDPYMQLWREQRQELGIESEWVFVKKDYETKEWIRRNNVSHWTEEFSEILNCPFYYHSCRHKLCTDLVSANIPAEVIREFFQWESVDMITVYNDSSAVDDFAKYFSAEGIVEQQQKNISDIGGGNNGV